MRPVQRRLGDVQITLLDEFPVLTEKEGQQQGADVRAVHVGVGHDGDGVVAQLGEVDVALAADHPDAGPHGRNQGLDFLVGQHLVETGAFHVENLAPQRQNSLGGRVAPLLGRTTGRITFDDVQFGIRRVFTLAVGQFAGQGVVGKSPFAAHQIFGFAGRVPGSGGVHGLFDDQFDVFGVFFKKSDQTVIDDAAHQAGHFRVAEFGLGLALELRVGQLDGNHGRKAFTHIIARKGHLELFVELGVFQVIVDGPGQRGFKTGQVRAAFFGADVVGKGQNVFFIARVVLQRKLGHDPRRFAVAVNDGVHRGFALVEVFDELMDAAVKAEQFLLAAAFVREFDFQPFIEVGQFFQTFADGFVRKNQSLEYFIIREKAHGGAVVLGFTQHLQFFLRHAPGILLRIAMPVAANGHFKVFRKGVDARYTHAVQTAGNLVAVVVELAAGVQLGHDHLHGGHALFGVDIHRNAPAVVRDRTTAVHMQAHGYLVAITGHGFVYGVVHHFVNKVMQTTAVRTAYVHGRALAHRGQTFENSYAVGIISRLTGFLGH